MFMHKYIQTDGIKNESIEIPEELISVSENEDGDKMHDPDLNKIHDWACIHLNAESCTVGIKYWSGSTHATTEIYIWDTYLLMNMEPGKTPTDINHVYFNFDSFA